MNYQNEECLSSIFSCTIHSQKNHSPIIYTSVSNATRVCHVEDRHRHRHLQIWSTEQVHHSLEKDASQTVPASWWNQFHAISTSYYSAWSRNTSLKKLKKLPAWWKTQIHLETNRQHALGLDVCGCWIGWCIVGVPRIVFTISSSSATLLFKLFLSTFNISFCAESNWSLSWSCCRVIWAATISPFFLFISDIQLQ